MSLGVGDMHHISRTCGRSGSRYVQIRPLRLPVSSRIVTGVSSVCRYVAAVTWRRDRLRITLSARNLFDRAYYWNGDGETADPGQPRQVVVTASIRLK